MSKNVVYVLKPTLYEGAVFIRVVSERGEENLSIAVCGSKSSVERFVSEILNTVFKGYDVKICPFEDSQ